MLHLQNCSKQTGSSKKDLDRYKLSVDKQDVAGTIKKWNAILRKEYGITPEELNEDEWAQLVCEYQYIEERRRKMFKNDMKIVLYELAAKIYGKK